MLQLVARIYYSGVNSVKMKCLRLLSARSTLRGTPFFHKDNAAGVEVQRCDATCRPRDVNRTRAAFGQLHDMASTVLGWCEQRAVPQRQLLSFAHGLTQLQEFV